MLFDLNKDYIFQNILCFIFLLIIINKLGITLKHIYSFIIVIILWYIYFYYTNNNNKIHLEKINYIQKFIEGNSYYDNHDKFINFIYDNQRFEHTKNYTELINIINTFLKVYSELKKNFIAQKLDNCRDMYKNALNTYQSLIYSISTIDNNYQSNLHRLDNIFKIYLSNLKYIEKENYNVKNINNLSRPYDENIVESNDNHNVFHVF